MTDAHELAYLHGTDRDEQERLTRLQSLVNTAPLRAPDLRQGTAESPILTDDEWGTFDVAHAESFDAALASFRQWCRLPGASFWSVTCWAQGRRPRP